LHAILNYRKEIEILSNIKVVTDAVEYSIKLIGDLNKVITKDKNQKTVSYANYT
jgi:hypothetical protein